MRGKARQAVYKDIKHGITPACAGKRMPGISAKSCPTDHPRMCGEKALSTFSSLKNSGSPPRMRGKVNLNGDFLIGGGITPAHAGKSGQGRARDHPRTCGEKENLQTEKRIQVGSPPHMRGKVFVIPAVSLHLGITPAHAGKRNVLRMNLQMRWDHPRTCGEKLYAPRFRCF